MTTTNRNLSAGGAGGSDVGAGGSNVGGGGNGLSAGESRVMAAIRSRHAAMIDDLTRWVGIPTGPRAVETRSTPHEGLAELRAVLATRLESLGAKGRVIAGDPRPAWIAPGGSEEETKRRGEETKFRRDGETKGGKGSNAGGGGSNAGGGGSDAGGGEFFEPTLLMDRMGSAVKGIASGGVGEMRVLLSGHLDTVHPVEGAFSSLTIDDRGEKALGPGCVDMKGGLVVAVHALEALEECGIRVPWAFVLNSDEETGTFCSDAAIRAAARNADVGLAFEPAPQIKAIGDTTWGLVTHRPGSGQFRIDVRGKAAHVGRDFKSGVSAVTALSRAILEISSHADADRGRIVSIGPIKGGHATNVVPDSAFAWGNVRYITPEVGEELRAAIEGLVHLGGMDGGLPAISVHATLNRPAKPLNTRVEALSRMIMGAAAAIGEDLRPTTTGGVCDGNNMQAAGLPTLDTLGVRGGGLHTTDEWIDLTSLVDRATLIAVVLMRLNEGRLESA
ncbi:MAG: M20/M25/M40 family metallo-hydrolase [Phycisphaerales bacterium]|nr:MAG: M20/M25/M40 family metallo-hydrolase [Phycisphaerales bacterium]